MVTARGNSYTWFIILCLLNIVDTFFCKSGISLGKVSPQGGKLKCLGSLIEKCSVTYTKKTNGNEIWMFSCAVSSSKCRGKRILRNDIEMKYCCCEKENCNDVEFAKRCSSGIQNIANSCLLIILVVLIKILVG